MPDNVVQLRPASPTGAPVTPRYVDTCGKPITLLDRGGQFVTALCNGLGVSRADIQTVSQGIAAMGELGALIRTPGITQSEPAKFLHLLNCFEEACNALVGEVAELQKDRGDIAGLTTHRLLTDHMSGKAVSEDQWEHVQRLQDHAAAQGKNNS